MKKLTAILAAVLTLGATAFAQPPQPPQELTKAQKTELAKARTESMRTSLGLSDRQVKKVSCLNKRYADVLGEEKSVAKPIYGDKRGPFYDTPGRPHPSGRNGVPGSWGMNDGGAPSEQGLSVGPAPGNAPQDAPEPPDAEKLAKRRAKYVKKLGKVLTAEQFDTWKSSQRPFPGEAL